MGKQFADAPESKAALTIDFVVVFLFSDWLNRTFLGASTLLANAATLTQAQCGRQLNDLHVFCGKQIDAL